MRSTWQDGGGGGYQLALPGMTPWTKLLLIANGAVFVVFLLLSGEAMRGAQRALLELLALDPGAWRGWLVPVWQVVTYGFVHLDAWHLLFNLLMVYFFGTMVEGITGSRRFATTYFAGVALGGVVQLGLGLLDISRIGADGVAVRAAAEIPLTAITYGASGGAMCLLVAAATLQPHTRVIFILFPLPLYVLALIFVGLDVVRLAQGSSGTAWAVHLAGAAYGFAAVRAGWIWIDPLEAIGRRRARRQFEAHKSDQERLDELLARIHRDGIGSLSKRERAFLNRVSQKR